MLKEDQMWFDDNTLRKPCEGCICKNGQSWLYGWDWDDGQKYGGNAYVTYIKWFDRTDGDDVEFMSDREIENIEDKKLFNVEYEGENFINRDVAEYGPVNVITDTDFTVCKLKRDQFHAKLNPIVGACFCCDCEVYALLRHDCCDCGVLLCSDCILRDRYGFSPQESGFVCFLCRVQPVSKNMDKYYSGPKLTSYSAEYMDRNHPLLARV